MSEHTLEDLTAWIQVGGERRYLSGVWPFSDRAELEVIGEALMGDRWNDDARKMFSAGAVGALLAGVLATDDIAEFLTEIGANGTVHADFNVRLGDFTIFTKRGYEFRFTGGETDYHPAGLVDLPPLDADEIAELREAAEAGNLDEETREKLDMVYPEHEALQVCMDNLGPRGIQEVTFLTFEMIQSIIDQVFTIKRSRRNL